MGDLTVLTAFAMFGAGVASFLNPCVLPLVPIWAGLSLDAGTGRASQTLRTAVPFVGGMTATFTALGAGAGAAGGLVDQAGQWLPRIGGALTVLFGLALLGVGPRWLRGAHHAFTELPSADVRPAVRSAVAGITVGAAWTPCAGPLLGAALTVAASHGGTFRGAALLGAYGVGIGTPFVAVALALDSWPGITRSLARRARTLQLLGGAVLMVVGAAAATGSTSRLVDPLARLVGRG